MKMKDETGRRYGSFIIIAPTNKRYALNGTVNWLCRCKNCGAEKIANGNALRFNRVKPTCRNCEARNYARII